MLTSLLEDFAAAYREIEEEGQGWCSANALVGSVDWLHSPFPLCCSVAPAVALVLH